MKARLAGGFCQTHPDFESLIWFCFYGLEKAKSILSLLSISPWIGKLKFSMITLHTEVMLDQNPSKGCQAHSQTGKCSRANTSVLLSKSRNRSPLLRPSQ